MFLLLANAGLHTSFRHHMHMRFCIRVYAPPITCSGNRLFLAISVLWHSIGQTRTWWRGEIGKEELERLTYFKGLDSGNAHLSESERVKEEIWGCVAAE